MTFETVHVVSQRLLSEVVEFILGRFPFGTPRPSSTTQLARVRAGSSCCSHVETHANLASRFRICQGRQECEVGDHLLEDRDLDS